MTGEATTDTSGLTLLGHGAALPASPEAATTAAAPAPSSLALDRTLVLVVLGTRQRLRWVGRHGGRGRSGDA